MPPALPFYPSPNRHLFAPALFASIWQRRQTTRIFCDSAEMSKCPARSALHLIEPLIIWALSAWRAANRGCSFVARRKPGVWWPSATVQSSQASSTANPHPWVISAACVWTRPSGTVEFLHMVMLRFTNFAMAGKRNFICPRLWKTTGRPRLYCYRDVAVCPPTTTSVAFAVWP